ncbi:MAG: hypothetical protein JO093_13690 [Acidobacteria bacterium]|nr:hypothetical protein [Acidobacteriota bacterium]MBV9068518.1 hypothetical protein [Acidobacteriota bacterium]MBV9186666.1 hypothetical protein [Acidobacteriota bacterium]
MSALILGATGAGKTRFLLSLLLNSLQKTGGFANRDHGVEIDLIDPKAETFDLLRKSIAALWLRATPQVRAEIARSVRVIDWSRDRVTPLAPFDNPAGSEISNAYLAHTRADVTVRSSAHAYTDSMRQLLYMWNWLLVELRYPLNYRFAVRFMHEEPFRRTVLSRVKEPEVRYYFESLDLSVPRQTRDGFLRRLQWSLSFPEIKASYIPPAAMETLSLTHAAPITLANTACTTTLPLGIGYERAAWRATDVLLAAPRRDPRRPKIFVLEEAVRFFADPNSDQVETLLTGLRTLRSVNMGIVLTAQDFSNAMPGPVARAVLLNTTWIAGFRAREDAEIFWPHVVFDGTAARSVGERRDAFMREMAGLARQRYLLLVKGEPALPLRAPDMPNAAHGVGASEEELTEIFNREIAAKSMIRTAVALDLIAKWESEVVDRAEAPPARDAATKPPRITSLADLKSFFSGKADT